MKIDNQFSYLLSASKGERPNIVLSVGDLNAFPWNLFILVSKYLFNVIVNVKEVKYYPEIR